MDMFKVKFKFNNDEESNGELPRVPVAGDWIYYKGNEYKIDKVILYSNGNVSAFIDSDIKCEEKVKKIKDWL